MSSETDTQRSFWRRYMLVSGVFLWLTPAEAPSLRDQLNESFARSQQELDAAEQARAAGE